MKTSNVKTPRLISPTTPEIPVSAVVQFLDEFSKLHYSKELAESGANVQKSEKSILISMKVEPGLLQAFRTQCKLQGVPYQTQIKKLMRAWLQSL